MKPTLPIARVEVGQALPDLDLPVTAAIVVGGALASRDYTPVHHDRAAAIAQGLPDIFMNILTTQGLVSRYVTDWAGPDVRVKGVRTKLGGPCMPGDSLKLRGRIVAIDGSRVDVEVVGSNAWGLHVSATFELEWPSREPR